MFTLLFHMIMLLQYELFKNLFPADLKFKYILKIIDMSRTPRTQNSTPFLGPLISVPEPYHFDYCIFAIILVPCGIMFLLISVLFFCQKDCIQRFILPNEYKTIFKFHKINSIVLELYLFIDYISTQLTSY